MPDLILELFSEEIPARMQARAAADLERLVNERLLGAGFLPEGVKAFAGPRRLALVAAGLPGRQPDRKEEKKGPRVGAPEKAVEGFLKSAGLSSLGQCEVRDDKKGQFYVAVVEEKGRDTASVIAAFMPEIIRAFPWPKSMRWGDGDLRWVRPLKSILCCFDGEVVGFEIDGIRSGDVSQGHRFLAPQAFRARTFDKYEAGLRAGKVVLDTDARAELIEREAKTLCEAQGLELVEDRGLLAEVAGLSEWPVPMMGSFDEKFLAVPDEVLIASMRGHQKYFSVRDPKTGRLANRFVYVANIEAPDAGKAMRAGYERVLTARLSDAWYLYHQDLKTPLAERVAELDRITFFEGLGTVGDKAKRVAVLAKEIAPAVGADPALAEKAALLAKADLVTQMVREFPELQGVMGWYYALAQGSFALRDAPAGAPQGVLRDAGLRPAPQDEGERALHPEEPSPSGEGVSKDEALRAIADAIRDHYKPQGADDDVPAAPVSVAVALADKIDTLTAFWAIGKKPTGSSDPFALRRAALGVIGVVHESGVRLKLSNLIASSYLELADGAFRPRMGDYRVFGNLPTSLEEAEGRTSKLPSIFNPPYDILFGYGRFYEKEGDALSLALSGYEGIFPNQDRDDAKKERNAIAANAELKRRLEILNEMLNMLIFDDLTDPEDEGRTMFQRLKMRANLLPTALSGPIAEILPSLLSFFHDRLKIYLRDKSHHYDHIDAVLAKADGMPEDDLVLIVRKLEALEAFLKTDDGANLAAGFKRAANILKAPAREGAHAEKAAFDPALLQQAEEKALFAALETAEDKAKKAVAAEKFEDAMTALASLRAPIDAFFDKVTVNADKPELRGNRLALLARFRAATAQVADLSKLEG